MKITVDIRAEEFLARLKGAGERLHAVMVRVVTRLSIEIQAAVVSDKLSGQVLHTRTGTLRRSINRVVFDEPGRILAQVGTNVVYARVHEYGFQGIQNVREHARKGHIVRAHVRNVNMPERSFLRSTLREFEQKIRTDIRRAAMEALK
jgi:phage gpG-like protein